MAGRRRKQAREKHATDTRWWKLDEESAASTCWVKAEEVREQSNFRRTMDELHAHLYSGAASLFGKLDQDSEYDPAQLPFNVVRNGSDTLVAMLSKNRPLPTIITSRGNYKQQKAAKLMSTAIEGEFARNKFWRVRPQVLRDACVFGTGCLRVDRVGDRIVYERVLPMELLVDRADGLYGTPRSLYRFSLVDRFVALERFAGDDETKRAAILDADAPTSGEDVPFWVSENEDRILILEAWHLPSKKGGSDGRHMIVCGGVALVDEGWKRERFPFAFLRKNDPLIGFFGHGLAEEMAGFQLEINVLADKVQQSHHLLGGAHWMVGQGSEIVDSHITNGVGNIVKFKGQQPTVYTPQPVNAETYQYLQDLGSFALNYSGISQMSAQSQKPAGIVAAKALQVLDDIETQRFMVFARADEDFCVDVSTMTLELMEEISSEIPDYTVRVAKDRKQMLAIKWSEVRLDDNAYVIQVFPTSMLAKTPAARLQQVQDLYQAKVIDRAMFLKLLDAPDLDAEMDLDAAARKLADEQIEVILEAETFKMPPGCEPTKYQDLVYARSRAQANLNDAQMDGLENWKQRLLQAYIDKCSALLDLAQRPPAPPPGSMPTEGAPMGAPAEPPVPSPDGATMPGAVPLGPDALSSGAPGVQ